jgi:hypothetical protein
MSDAGEDTAAWTGFQTGSSMNDVRSFFPDREPCPHGGSNHDVPEQDANDSSIHVTNGELADAWQTLHCIWEKMLGCKDTDGDGIVDAQGGNIFTIPIFHVEGSNGTCEVNFNQSREVVGFATIEIKTVINDPGDRLLDIQTLSLTDSTPVFGSNCFGTCGVAMVR